jgi:hypothetical protein
MSTLRLLVSSLVLSMACGSSDPEVCNGKGSYAGADACSKLKQSFEAKCSSQGLKFDCNQYFRATACSTSNRFCSEGVDKAVSDLGAAADCDAAQKLTLKTYCF